MRILQLANKVPYPPNDGGAIATLNHTTGFAHAGCTVTTLAMYTPKHFVDPERVSQKLQAHTRLHPVFVNTSVKAHKLLLNLLFSRMPYNAARFISVDFREQLKNLLQTQTFDVVHLEGLYLMPYVDTIRAHSKALVSLRAHNVEHEIWARTAKQSKGLAKPYLNILAKRIAQFEKASLNQYDLLVPITQKDLNWFNAAGNTKPAFVCPTGYSEPAQEANFVAQPSVFHIGGLDWAPNQQGLIWFLEDVWPKLSGKFPQLKFRIAGRNAPAWLQKKLQGPQVEFVGEVPSAQEFMQQNKILIVPLHSGSGMRIKIIEGLALGKPVVSTTIGAEGIECSPNEDILIADTAQEFANGIEKLLKNPDFCRQISNKAIQLIRHKYDNNKIVGELVSFFQQHTNDH